MLVLSHENASYEERAPYLAAKWDPMPIVVVYGRCATLQPTVLREQSVWYGWRDHILPLILSKKFMPDTLFIVAEEDWRIDADDVPVTMADLTGLDAAGVSPSPAAAQSSASAVASSTIWDFPQDGLQPEPQQDFVPDWGGAPCSEPVAEEGASLPPREPFAAGVVEEPFLHRVFKQKRANAEFPKSLKDVVHICTTAHRCDIGDLVWLSWEPSRRACHPGHGTTAVCLTQMAAEVLLPWVQTTQLFHFDVNLVKGLSKPDPALAALKACYVHPTVGSFAEHISGIETHAGGGWVRAGTWEKRHIGDGTRVEGRHLMGFCEKGIKWMGVVSHQGFDHPEHKWFSLRDPSGQWDPMRAADEALGAYTEERGTQDHVSPSPAVEKKPSLRSKRATRGHKLRENLRLWTDDFHLAARVFRLRAVSLFRIFFLMG